MKKNHNSYWNNIFLFFLNSNTKETFLKYSNIVIFRNTNNITCDLILTSRQTMHISFTPYSYMSRHCIDSSCAELPFISFVMFTDDATCILKWGMASKLGRHLGFVLISNTLNKILSSIYIQLLLHLLTFWILKLEQFRKNYMNYFVTDCYTSLYWILQE